MSTKVEITIMFGADATEALGVLELFDPEKMAKLLLSGEFTFAPSFHIKEGGMLELIGISLIPAEMTVNPHTKITMFYKCAYCHEEIHKDAYGIWLDNSEIVPKYCLESLSHRHIPE